MIYANAYIEKERRGTLFDAFRQLFHIARQLSHKTVYASRERPDKTLQFKHRQFGCHIAVGQLRFHDKQVDVHPFFRFLQFG